MRYRRNGLGQGEEPLSYWPTEYYAPMTPSGNVVTEIFSTPPTIAPASTPAGSGGDLWTNFAAGASSLLRTVLPLAERYDLLRPVVGRNPDGSAIYATATLPVGGASGAAFTSLSQVAFLGLTWGQVLLLGGGAILVFSMMRK